MSQGNAAAIRRRVKNLEQPKLTSSASSGDTTSTTSSTANSNLSINDAFVIVNERLVNLEKQLSNGGDNLNTENSSYAQEYENRFNLIAQEIGELKETVLKLQTFTMDVNKVLYDERIKILGDVDKSTNETIFNVENIENKE